MVSQSVLQAQEGLPRIRSHPLLPPSVPARDFGHCNGLLTCGSLMHSAALLVSHARPVQLADTLFARTTFSDVWGCWMFSRSTETSGSIDCSDALQPILAR